MCRYYSDSEQTHTDTKADVMSTIIMDQKGDQADFMLTIVTGRKDDDDDDDDVDGDDVMDDDDEN